MIDKILAICSLVTLLCVALYLGHNLVYQNDVVVIVELQEGEDPLLTIPKIVPTYTHIKDVKEVDGSNNEYELTMKTSRQTLYLLKWLSKNPRVKTATIKK